MFSIIFKYFFWIILNVLWNTIFILKFSDKTCQMKIYYLNYMIYYFTHICWSKFSTKNLNNFKLKRTDSVSSSQLGYSHIHINSNWSNTNTLVWLLVAQIWLLSELYIQIILFVFDFGLYILILIFILK